MIKHLVWKEELHETTSLRLRCKPLLQQISLGSFSNYYDLQFRPSEFSRHPKGDSEDKHKENILRSKSVYLPKTGTAFCSFYRRITV